MTDNWKALFWHFCVFLVFFLRFLLFSFLHFYFFCFFLFFVFFGGFKGQVRWPEGPPHLALNPPYFFFVSFFCYFLFLFCFCFGGFKGQVRWPQGPPHLALNPPYLLFVCFFWFVFVPFLSLLCTTKKPCFPPRKGHFWFIFECLPLFLLTFFGPPPFSIFLSLSISSSSPFFPSFLSFFFAFFCFLVFVSFFPFLSSLLLFHEKNNIRNIDVQCFSSSIFSHFWFPVFFSLWNPFFFSLFFCWFKVMFLFSIFVFGFKKTKLKNTNLWSKGGLQQNVFFYEPVFCKMWKVIVVCWGHFLGKFWLMFKKHYKNRYFSTSKKAKTWEKWPFSKSITGPS